MSDKTRKVSLRLKTCILIIAITFLLVGIALTVSYSVNKKNVDDYYKALVSHIGRSEASIIDSEIVSLFLVLVQTDEYQQILEEAIAAENEQAVIDYLESRGMYDDYLRVNAQLERFRGDMEVRYLYLESVQGSYSLSLFDPQESILNFGIRLETADEFSGYTTNDPIPATVSETEYGWLCTGYESIVDDSGEKIAIVGVDIDMNEIVHQRRTFLRNLLIYMLLYVFGAAGLSMYLMHRMVVRPLDLLAGATKKFVNSENYSLDRVISLPLHTGDEIEELYTSVQKLENDIIIYIENLTKITAEKERIGAELNVATQIQADMLPSIFPAFPGREEFDIYATMDPAKEVGGDFYDFFLVDDDHLAMVMADVSGKGVPAALFMVIAKTLIKNRTQMGGTPSEILAYVNDQLCEGNEAELFVTVWLAILEISTGKGVAANAGHEHPVIRRADNLYELIEYRHSPAVATMEGIRFREHEFELYPGDSLYVYTDGVPEATNASDELFGTDRMLEALNKNPNASAEEILNTVRKHVDIFVDEAPQFDDVTMLCLKYFGKGDLADGSADDTGKS